MKNSPGKTQLLAYAFIALPLSFAGLPLYIYIPDFYATTFGINIGVLGALLLAIRLIDAVQDPLIGYLSDINTRHRITIIFAGIALLVAGMAGLASGPPVATGTAIWFTLCMIAATTGFSIATININTIGGFWKKDAGARILISAWRERLGLIGILLAAILPAALQTRFAPEVSHIIVFAVFAMLMAIAVILFLRFAKHFAMDNCMTKKNSRADTGFAIFRIAFGSDKIFFAICFLSYLAASIPAVLVLFFIRDYLNAENLTGGFLGLYFIAGAVFMPLWVRLARRKGAYRAWAYAMALAVLTFFGAVFLMPGNIAGYAAICALSGIALGADLALPPAIIAGRITAAKAETRAIQYYAILAFLPKLAIALAAGGSFLALDAFGFAARADNPQAALKALLVLYALVPCVIKIASGAMLMHLIAKEERQLP